MKKNLKKRLLTTLAIMALSVVWASSLRAADTTMLTFIGNNTSVQVNGIYLIPSSVWSSYDEFRVKVPIHFVRGPDGSLLPVPRFGIGFEDWTGVNSWVPPGNSIYIGKDSLQKIPIMYCDVPGGYGNTYGAYGEKQIYINFIDDPYLTVGAIRKRLSQWSFPLVVPQGTLVKLEVHPFFVSGGGSNVVWKEGSLFAMMQTEYIFNETGNYTLTTGDGAFNPLYELNFSITFQSIQYTITASAGSGGSISPSGAVTVNAGASQQFTATPQSGKEVDTWKVNGAVVQTGGNTYTVTNVQANATVNVSFKEIPPVQYTLTASAESGGSISPSGNIAVNVGENKVFTATPEGGKEVDVWKVNSVVVQTGGNTYTVANVQANATVNVSFKEIPPVQYTLTASAESGGSISPSGNIAVNVGENKVFTATLL